MSDPESRNEALLGNLLGESNEFGEPQSANEAILQNMLGANNVIREPQSRIESMLKEILDGGGMGGGSLKAIVKMKSSKTLSMTYKFSAPGTFYITQTAHRVSSASSSTLSTVEFTAEDGEAVTSTRSGGTASKIYAYKVVVTEDEDSTKMVFKLSASTQDYTAYGLASCWYPDTFETAPVTIT